MSSTEWVSFFFWPPSRVPCPPCTRRSRRRVRVRLRVSKPPRRAGNVLSPPPLSCYRRQSLCGPLVIRSSPHEARSWWEKEDHPVVSAFPQLKSNPLPLTRLSLPTSGCRPPLLREHRCLHFTYHTIVKGTLRLTVSSAASSSASLLGRAPSPGAWRRLLPPDQPPLLNPNLVFL